MLNLSLSPKSLSCLCVYAHIWIIEQKSPRRGNDLWMEGGINRKKKLPSSSSSSFGFPFFFYPKSPIIYLSLFSLFLCVYLYIDIHTESTSEKKKKYRIPHVWSLIGSAQYRNVVAQGKTKRREMCVFLWWANGLYMFLLLLLVCFCGGRRTLLLQRAGCTGVDGHHHLGFSLAFHSRSVARSICRAQEPAHTNTQRRLRIYMQLSIFQNEEATTCNIYCPVSMSSLA